MTISAANAEATRKVLSRLVASTVLSRSSLRVTLLPMPLMSRPIFLGFIRHGARPPCPLAVTSPNAAEIPRELGLRGYTSLFAR